MTFIVNWTRAALRELLDLWTTATDPDAVDVAATRIEVTLATDAHLQGESRENDVRILFDPPLVVLFVPDIDVGIVYIVSVDWSGDAA
ncbi:MAG: hypothetical protein FJ304_01210 [Planctomycetes bacterium]|nr:hypothetical protein [Planctomycetota bacterium]